MPKIVDHEARRAEIADALWQVIRRDGLAGASVRSVAEESGWSVGAIRHYFTTQGELLGFAAELMIARIRDRLATLDADLGTVAGLAAVVELTLPLDQQSRADAEVWLALVATSRTDETLRPIAMEAHQGLRVLIEGVVGLAHGIGGLDLPPRPVRQAETDRFHGMLDGLAVQGVLYPRQMPGTRIRAAVVAELERMAAANPR